MSIATIDKPRAVRKARAKAPGVGQAKLTQLSDILWQASQWDGDLSSGYSLRLLRIASEMALDDAKNFDALRPDNQVDKAFDLAALVSSARRVPKDQPMPSGLAALIASAHTVLNDLTDCEDCFDDGEERAAVEPAPMLNGYTPMQLMEILDHIACSTEAAAEILMDVEGHIGGEAWTPSQCKTTLHVAAQAVRMVGAMADQASGTHLIGGPIEWSIGDRDLKGNHHA
ncbi:hypothetical protein [Pseudorhodoferax soli]|uniref:Uncharacterized protein n=1 Tax=Pseudorhodoferax soli TaxID=545864 RepID=A0A368Y0R9_9BURK|nr:hypothetical protein [Pseudorhodoferax soli]RCW73843.1 hypothetical protein DES41_102157 [Pseudorhodoferax soli]